MSTVVYIPEARALEAEDQLARARDSRDQYKRRVLKQVKTIKNLTNEGNNARARVNTLQEELRRLRGSIGKSREGRRFLLAYDRGDGAIIRCPGATGPLRRNVEPQQREHETIIYVNGQEFGTWERITGQIGQEVKIVRQIKRRRSPNMARDAAEQMGIPTSIVVGSESFEVHGIETEFPGRTSITYAGVLPR